MINEVFRTKDNTFHWVDVVDPKGFELLSLQEKYDLSPTALKDCLDPKHLPKYESFPNQAFLILRAYDDTSEPSAGTVQQLSQKIAIFIGKDYLITVHRRDQPFIVQIRERFAHSLENEQQAMPKLLGRIIQSVLTTYNQALTLCENQLEDFEEVIFNEETSSFSIQQKFILKRQAYVFKRLLKLTHDIFPKLKMIEEVDPAFYQDLKEHCENVFFEAENIQENVNNLITLNLSLASHNTNEVVRVLTIFSVFFLPLTFIVGNYGMNFQNMPELKWEYGYPLVWLLMILISALLYFWFRRRGWL